MHHCRTNERTWHDMNTRSRSSSWCVVIVAAWLAAGLTSQVSGSQLGRRRGCEDRFSFLPFFSCFGFWVEALIANGSYITEYRVHRDLPYLPLFLTQMMAGQI